MVNWWLGVARAREAEPKPDLQKRKAQAPHERPPAIPKHGAPKLFGLTRDVEIYTPSGTVDAEAGDLLVLYAEDSQIRVTPPEHVPLSWLLKVME